MIEVDEVLRRSRVIPVVTLNDLDDAVPLARALLRGGVDIIEVTLRSEPALEGISLIRQEIPEMLVGAGTVWTPDDWRRSETAGAQFIVSPGAPAALLKSAPSRGLPYLPGAQTVTEIERLVGAGYKAVKFFPAEPAGGVSALSACASVFPGLRFCPTGGIDVHTASHYLALDAVPCVGGSWLTPRDAVREKRWGVVTARAREAAQLA